jgi:hypothetical protein
MGIIKGIGRHLVNRVKAIIPEVAQTAQAKVAQGSTEVSNALFGQATGYSPYTADNAQRAQYQNRDQSRGMER